MWHKGADSGADALPASLGTHAAPAPHGARGMEQGEPGTGAAQGVWGAPRALGHCSLLGTTPRESAGEGQDSDLSAHPCLQCPAGDAWPRFASNLNFIKSSEPRKILPSLPFFFFFFSTSNEHCLIVSWKGVCLQFCAM